MDASTLIACFISYETKSEQHTSTLQFHTFASVQWMHQNHGRGAQAARCLELCKK